jgi:hypothetical protein
MISEPEKPGLRLGWGRATAGEKYAAGIPLKTAARPVLAFLQAKFVIPLFKKAKVSG